jgi:hypothetical protein
MRKTFSKTQKIYHVEASRDAEGVTALCGERGDFDLSSPNYAFALFRDMPLADHYNDGRPLPICKRCLRKEQATP